MGNYTSAYTGAQIDEAIGNVRNEMIYVCDATESDQGAVGSGNSLKDFIDSIGTSKSATIYLLHSGTGNTTTYTVSTDETVPSNIRLKIENGAVLTDDASNANLTINGQIEAGLYQIFDWSNGTGSIGVSQVAYAEWFGVDGTDDQTQIQLALDTGAPYVQLLGKTYSIGDAGTLTDYRVGGTINYAIKVPSNSGLIGMGYETILSQANSEDAKIIINSNLASGSNSNITLKNFKIVGNSVNNTDNEQIHGIHLANVSNLIMDNLWVSDSPSYCYRLEDCDNIQIGKLRGDTDSNGRDGIKFIDCEKVTAESLIMDTYDDGVSITAWDGNVADYSIGQIISKSSSARGVLLNLADNTEQLGTEYTIKNVNIGNIVTRDCGGYGTLLNYANFENIHLNITDYGSKSGFAAWLSTDNVSGSMMRCLIDVTTTDNDEQGVIIYRLNKGEVAEYNILRANVENPGDTYSGINIGYGTGWDVSGSVDYDPASGKGSPSYGIRYDGNVGRVSVNVDAGSNNIYVATPTGGDAPDNNIFTGCVFTNPTGAANINIASGTGNKVISSYWDTAVTDDGTATEINGQLDYSNSVGSTLTSGTGEDDLKSFTIPQNYHLKARGLRITTAGNKTGGNGNKTIKWYLGATAYTVNGAVNDTTDWTLDITIIFASGTAQKVYWTAYRGATAVSRAYADTAKDMTAGSVDIKLTGECANAADVIAQKFWLIEKL